MKRVFLPTLPCSTCLRHPLSRAIGKDVYTQLHSLVISEKMANKFFGEDKNIVGKTLRVDNKEEFIISGVIKDIPENSTIKFDWIAPFKIYYDKNEWLQSWGNNGIQTFAELDDKTNPEQFNRKFKDYIKSKDTSAIAKPFLFAMDDWRLRTNLKMAKQAAEEFNTFACSALSPGHPFDRLYQFYEPGHRPF